jgi:outer membrane protein assembly factor BamB
VSDIGSGVAIGKKSNRQHSADSTLVYAKTMEGELIGISAQADSMQIVWRSNTGLNYEIAPTAIAANRHVIYVPSNSGLVIAVNPDGSVRWKHKISNALITCVVPVSKDKVIATTMDGKITCLKYEP